MSNIKSKIIITLSIVFVLIIFPKNTWAIQYSATWGPAGKLIEATGASFGNVKGEITFSSTDRTEKAAIYSWANDKVVFQIPLSPPSRDFKIKTQTTEYVGSYLAKGFSDYANLNSTNPIVLNPDQGMGQCHAVDAGGFGKTGITWAYPPSAGVPWWQIEPNEGQYDWKILDDMVTLARNANKKVWLQVATAEGAIPDWAASRVPTAGIRCDSRPSNQVGRSGCDASYSIDGKNHTKGTPIPWNPQYQLLLRKLVHTMAERYDGNPNVEAILTMAGGCYGEQSICNYTSIADKNQWLNAGYTNEKFRDASKQIMDIYLEDSYSWPDGKVTHGFLKKPIVIQLGMGLDPAGSGVIAGGVAQYVVEKYGLRVWLKQNGWGNHTCGTGGFGDYNWLYQKYVGKTRVGYERGHWEVCNPCGGACVCAAACQLDCNFQLGNFKNALNDRSSFSCISPSDLSACSDYQKFTRFAGSHISLNNPQLSPSGSAGNQFIFNAIWNNTGNFPLTGQRRVGVKDELASYKLAFYFFDQSGTNKGRASVEPSWPTINWFGPDSFNTSNVFSAPAGLLSGTYTIKLALEDEGRNNLKFRLTGKGGLTEDESGLYRLGNVTISNTGTPSDTQAPTIPASLTATAVSSSQINLSWTASTDNVGVTGYRIYRNGTQITTVTTNSYQNTVLSPSTSYTYTVTAYDAAGNVSAQSASANATTQAPSDTTPPAAPSGVTVS